MKRFIADLEKSINAELYYSALFLGLSLIDICASIEYPNFKNIKQNKGTKSKTYNRYMKWADTFFIPLFEYDPANPILSSENLYAIRCKVLHEGTNHNLNNECKQVIFTLGASHRNKSIYSNGHEVITEIQLNLKKFLSEILESIKKWTEGKSENEITLNLDFLAGCFSTSELNGARGFYNCF